MKHQLPKGLQQSLVSSFVLYSILVQIFKVHAVLPKLITKTKKFGNSKIKCSILILSKLKDYTFCGGFLFCLKVLE